MGLFGKLFEFNGYGKTGAFEQTLGLSITFEITSGNSENSWEIRKERLGEQVSHIKNLSPIRRTATAKKLIITPQINNQKITFMVENSFPEKCGGFRNHTGNV